MRRNALWEDPHSSSGPKLAVLILFFCSRGVVHNMATIINGQKYNHKIMRIAIKFRVISVNIIPHNELVQSEN